MLSVSNLRSRPLGLIVALIISLAFFYSYYGGWVPNPSLYGSKAKTADPAASTSTSSQKALPSALNNHALSYDTSIPGIPDKIWHTAKDDTVTERQREWIRSWTLKNPYFRQELLTDRSSEAFVRAHFYESRPDIVSVYESLSVPILRADLLRYLILFAEGGVWSDLDVAAEKPVAEWVPPEFQGEAIDLIVGLEFDFAWRGPDRQVASQFCNWVFAARPGSRALAVVVDAVIDKLTAIADSNGVAISEITLDMFRDVVDVTGPKIMTIAILKSLQQLLGRTVDDRDFSGIKAPKLIGDVLIMPGTSFAAYQNGYPTDQGDDLVTHYYESSWKQADEEARERKKQKQKELDEQAQQQHV